MNNFCFAIEDKADILEIIKVLLQCGKDKQKCKKCKDRDECKQFMRQCIALCLQIIVNSKEDELDGDDLYI